MSATVPQFHELMLPTLRAVQSLGGSGSILEIESTVSETGAYSDEQLAILHNDGPQTEIGYRLAWARTYLKNIGLLTNSARSVWTLTDAGADLLVNSGLSDEELTERIDALRTEWRKQYRDERAARRRAGVTEAEDELVEDADTGDWKQELIALLTDNDRFSPDQFERLAKRLLREAGFDSVQVTGGSGDQGIDGVGVYRLGLLTFPVFFQCKRYKGSVDPSAVRDFRGAMQGRGEKGLLITTGTFTKGAMEEANRAGATPIDLVDGDRLCDLLKEYELGLTAKVIEEVHVVTDFYTSL